MNLMNSLAFDSDNATIIDANFISRYNSQEREFDYYAEKLLGISMENEEDPKEGNIWIPFINDKQEDWTYICRNGRIIEKKDKILWRFIHENTQSS